LSVHGKNLFNVVTYFTDSAKEQRYSVAVSSARFSSSCGLISNRCLWQRFFSARLWQHVASFKSGRVMKQIQQHFQRPLRGGTFAACLFSLSACSSIGNTISNVSIWPFAGPVERVAPPPNGVEYKCIGGKSIYLRYLDNNAAAWVILPEREFRLEKQGATARYVNGANVLTVEGETLSLTESSGAANAYSGCKVTTGAGAAGATAPLAPR
jgi:hypothetical protein